MSTDVELLRQAGVQVEVLAVESDAFLGTGQSRTTTAYAELRKGGSLNVSRILNSYYPDVVHIHNALPFFSLRALNRIQRSNAATVMTVHNYRFTCMAGTHQLDGDPCHMCQGRKTELPGVLNSCYRGSKWQSAAIAAKRLRALPILKALDHYFALTPELETYLVDQVGLDADRVTVRGNTILNRYLEPATNEPRGMSDDPLLYVGRFSEEKGISLLLRAHKALGPGAPRLQVVGSGPLIEEVLRATADAPSVQYLGRKTQNEVLGLMRSSSALIIPSTCYEGLPRVAVEAFSAGLPVIATNLGALANVINGSNGICVPPTVEDLSAAMGDLAESRVEEHTTRQEAAYATFADRFSPEKSLSSLMSGYEIALSRAKEARVG
ncbi:glycosyltransferase family 4 protein [Actinomycetospora sp. CA-084318]|uniref:glycosyltransferase family 4 protein n=1 Tax=Actinomycetospora sp. CA-084318 TaxID=3239892 RepID=UPI003D96923C